MRRLLHELMSTAVSNVWQDGGQRRARRNAWQAMVADNARARARADAATAVADAQRRLAIDEAAAQV
jgi:hypothetical protein